MGFRRAKSTQGNTNCQKNIFEDDQVPGHHPRALTLYHPPSQKSTVYGRWKKTSLTAKLLGRAALNLCYYVNRVLGNAVAASNHIVGIEFFVETTSASVFFLVFFLALRTDRVKEGTVMVIS